MKRLTAIYTMLLAVGLLGSDAWAQQYQLPSGVRAGQHRTKEFHGTGRASFHALKVGQSARAAAMGDAFTAAADDINAMFWNTAALTHIERFEYALGYTRWMVDSKFFNGAVAWRYGQQTFGLSVVQFDAGTSRETTPMDPQGRFTRDISAGDIFINFGYAYKMTDKLSLGASIKWIQETLDQDKINSASFDFSSVFYTGFGSSRLAMTLRNFGKDQELVIPGSLPQGTSIAQPLIYTIALAMEPYGRKGDPTYLTVAAELVHHIDDRERWHVGGELWVANTLALRAGYRGRYDLGTWTLGGGVQKDLGVGRRIGVDFAYISFGQLFDPPLRVSITGSF